MQSSRRLMLSHRVALCAAFVAVAGVSLASRASGDPRDNQPARPTVAASPTPRLITLDDVEGPNAADMDGWLPYIPQALADGRNFMEYGLDSKSGKPQFMKVAYQTGAQAPLYDAAKMERALPLCPRLGRNKPRALPTATV